MIGPFLFVIVAYLGLNAYIGARVLFYFRLALTPFGLAVFWPLYFILACSYFISMAFLGNMLGKLAHTIGGYWMVLFIYLLSGFVMMDAIRLLSKLPFFASLANGAPAYARVLAGMIVICGAAATVIYGAYHARQVTIEYYQVESVKDCQPGEIRVALISDLHLGSGVDAAWLGRIIDKINEVQPDVVCIAGDIFDNNLNSIRDAEQFTALFRRIRAPFGVYACLGNHDVDRISFTQAGDDEAAGPGNSIAKLLEDSNIILLQDEMALIDGKFYIAGRRDASPIGAGRRARLPAEDLTAARDKGRPLILLDHQPVDIQGAVAAGADLMLSGHTHKGQIFPASLVTRRIFLVYYGHKQVENTHVIVSSGAGIWGPPVRIGSNSEVAVIDFKWYNK